MPRETEVNLDYSYDPEWRRVRGIRICPMLIANFVCEGRGCICMRHDYMTILDHGKLWVDRDENALITYEPYKQEVALLGAFILQCKSLSLSVQRSEESPHYPGQTILLIVRAKPPEHRD